MRTSKLNVNTIKTDTTYQSPVNSTEVRKIVKNFNPKALTSIIVSQRTDGEYYVIDGQHRMSALKQMDIPMVEALIYTGLTRYDEAEMYAKINEIKAKTPNALGKAKYQSGDLAATQIHNAVENAGLFIDYDSTNRELNHVRAYRALERVNKKYGAEHLEETLVILKSVFDNYVHSFEAKNIDGMAKFLFVYRDDFDYKRLVKVVNRLGLAEFNRLYTQNKPNCDTTANAFAITLLNVYNKKLKEEQKLNKMKLLV
ncbi:hypothetical protein BFS35_011185 [Macrococcoides goetzii]|uniref:Uncharacterized protein n=1 Tax=Macrococcoides goetzii TaxID=1891097 RepID=A0A2G5NWT3_9STAP|nr:DUF6551 family protein [Macrococcus goetzii]RAI79702.1 hypothetical protein BFS35_011185 [Macrococcus goetzii]